MAWEDEYRGHGLWLSAQAALDNLAEVSADDLDDRLIRLRAVLSDIAAHDDQPHAALTTEHLDAVKNTLDTIGTSIPDSVETIFAHPRNQQNIPSPFNQLAIYARTWPATGSVSLRGLNKQIEQIETTFAALNVHLDERIGEVESQANKQATVASEALAQLKDDVEEQRRTFTTLVEDKSKELQNELVRIRTDASETDATIEQQKTRLDAALSSQQEKFSALQEERSEKWAELLRSSDKEFHEHLDVLKGYEEQSQNVLSSVGVNATATDYGNYANEQSEAANTWRGWALAAFSVAAAAFLVAAGASFFGYGANLDWWQVVFQKLGAPLGATALGYVLIRESGQHRREERASRQVQLTLTALEPFIANLPDDENRTVRLETARRIFAKDTNQKTSASKSEDATQSGPRPG